MDDARPKPPERGPSSPSIDSIRRAGSSRLRVLSREEEGMLATVARDGLHIERVGAVGATEWACTIDTKTKKNLRCWPGMIQVLWCLLVGFLASLRQRAQRKSQPAGPLRLLCRTQSILRMS